MLRVSVITAVTAAVSTVLLHATCLSTYSPNSINDGEKGAVQLASDDR